MPIILALDQAKESGFAYGEPGSVPKSGTFVVPATRNQQQYLWLFQQELVRLHEASGADVLVLEETFFGPKTPTSGMKLAEIKGALTAKSYDLRMKLLTVNSGSWKKAFCGNAGFNKKTMPYPPVDTCSVRGWRTGDNHNRADALGIWWWGCLNVDERSKKAALDSLPQEGLFAT